MDFPNLHSWDLKRTEAAPLQKELAQHIVIKPFTHEIKTFAACDVSFDVGGEDLFAAVAVFDRNMNLIEKVTVKAPGTFPYLSGLLSFRELPVLLKAFAQLAHTPDLILCDGQGIAHPRRLGIASHLGLWLDRPTIGSAKSKLCGTFEAPGPERGDFTALLHKSEVIGSVLRTKKSVQPIYVSPGHLCDQDDAREFVLRYVTRYRLPDPIRYVHNLSNHARKESKLSMPSERGQDLNHFQLES